MHFGLVSSRIGTILISAVFSAAIIRGEALIRARRLFLMWIPKGAALI